MKSTLAAEQHNSTQAWVEVVQMGLSARVVFYQPEEGGLILICKKVLGGLVVVLMCHM